MFSCILRSGLGEYRENGSESVFVRVYLKCVTVGAKLDRGQRSQGTVDKLCVIQLSLDFHKSEVQVLCKRMMG